MPSARKKPVLVESDPPPEEKTLKFVLEAETRGAFRYREINARGDILQIKDAIVGMLYLRKTYVGELPSEHFQMILAPVSD